MIDYQKILQTNPNGVLATVDNGKVQTRVFQYLFADGNKVYFSTDSQKPVYGQLLAHPQTSFCTYAADFAPVLSINGKAVFVDDMALKIRTLEENPPIKAIYKTPDNPQLRIFYIDVAEVVTYSFADDKKEYTI